LNDFGLNLVKGDIATIPKNLATSSQEFLESVKKGILKIVSQNPVTKESTLPSPSSSPQKKNIGLELKTLDSRSPETKKKKSFQEGNTKSPSIFIQNESQFMSDSHVEDLKSCISKENSSVKARLNLVEDMFSTITQKIDKSLQEIDFIKSSLKKDLNEEIKDVLQEVLFPIQSTLKQLGSIFESEGVEIVDKRKVFETVKLVVSECLLSMNSIDYLKIENIIDKIIQKNMENKDTLQRGIAEETFKMHPGRTNLEDLSVPLQDTFIPGKFNNNNNLVSDSPNDGVSKTSKKKR
jgi:glutaredoxin